MWVDVACDIHSLCFVYQAHQARMYCKGVGDSVQFEFSVLYMTVCATTFYAQMYIYSWRGNCRVKQLFDLPYKFMGGTAAAVRQTCLHAPPLLCQTRLLAPYCAAAPEFSPKVRKPSSAVPGNVAETQSFLVSSELL